jgi:hypothetical protein
MWSGTLIIKEAEAEAKCSNIIMGLFTENAEMFDAMHTPLIVAVRKLLHLFHFFFFFNDLCQTKLAGRRGHFSPIRYGMRWDATLLGGPVA